MIKYWHKLENISNSDFPLLFSASQSSKSLYTANKSSWYGSILKLLDLVKLNSTQITPSKSLLAKNCQIHVKNFYIDEYHSTLASSSGKLSTYLSFKTNFGCENYLHIIKNSKLRSHLTKFRISAHKLRIETGRYTKVAREDRICNKCNLNVVEDECHFLFHCPHYQAARLSLLDLINKKCENFTNLSNSLRLSWLLNCEDISILTSLCNFIPLHM